MGLNDGEDSIGGRRPVARGVSSGLSKGLKWGPAGILAFWLAIMGTLYVAMRHYLEPKPVSVSASGDLVIPRARDGHFYAAGSVSRTLTFEGISSFQEHCLALRTC